MRGIPRPATSPSPIVLPVSHRGVSTRSADARLALIATRTGLIWVIPHHADGTFPTATCVRMRAAARSIR